MKTTGKAITSGDVINAIGWDEYLERLAQKAGPEPEQESEPGYMEKARQHWRNLNHAQRERARREHWNTAHDSAMLYAYFELTD